MATAYLLVGSNLGNRTQHLQQAQQFLRQAIGNILQGSSVYETAAWGVAAQPAYLNQVLVVETALPPFELLEKTQEIEKQLGRIRSFRWAARTIDIDILFYDQLIISTQELTIPHSRILERKFVLQPLTEIAPDMLHPVWQRSIKNLLDSCEDNSVVEIFGKYFATDNKI